MTIPTTIGSALGALVARALPPLTEKGALLEWLAWGSGTGLALLGVYAAGLTDVWSCDARGIRSLGRRAWLFIVAVPMVGLLLWIVFGRPRPPARARPTGSTSARPGGRPGARPSRAGRSGNPKLTIVPPTTRSEELNAQIARSEELNRRLEAWEAQQRAEGKVPTSPPPNDAGAPPAPPAVTAPSEPPPLAPSDVPELPSSRAEVPPAPPPAPPENRDPAPAVRDASPSPSRPDPKVGDLSAWEADLSRWEEELRQPDPDDQ